MAASGTISQSYSNYRNLVVTIAGVTSGNTSQPFQSVGFPFGTIGVTFTGTIPTGVQLQGSNDNVNWANLGTAASSFPAMAPLTVNDESPALWYRLSVTGGDGTTLVNAIVLLTGSKA